MGNSSKNWNTKVITAKIETTEGTDSVPTIATDAIRVLNFTPQFMDADQKVRKLDKAFFGADPIAMAAFKRGFTFDMDMAGSGTTTGVPPWMKMMRAAGFDAGVVGGSSVVQTPISVIPSTSMYTWIDDLKLIGIGMRAGVGFKIEDDEFPTFSFNYLGRPPVAALAIEETPTTPSFSTYVDPVLSATENTTITLDGFAMPIRRIELNSNADLQFRSLIGPQDRTIIANRAWAGTIFGELAALTSKDYFPKIKTGATFVGQIVQGITAGNIVQIDIPKLQITGNAELSEEQGKMMVSFPVTCLPNAGNDEIVFTSK